jgi:hypothetical protein
MKRYVSWKGPAGIRKAEGYERELREKLGRNPTKRDFCEAGLRHVWMALYRKRRITTPGEKECAKIYGSIEQDLLKSKGLMEKVLVGMISTLGPDEFDAVLEKAKRKLADFLFA